MRRASRGGRPKKRIPSVRTTIPKPINDAISSYMKRFGMSKDEAWAYVLQKLSPISSPAGSDNEDENEGGDSDGELPPVRGKRVHSEDEEDDEPRVSEEDLSNHMASIPSALRG